MVELKTPPPPHAQPRLHSQTFAERACLDQAGLMRAAEVLGQMLDGGEPIDLHEMAARTVAAYAMGATHAAIRASRLS